MKLSALFLAGALALGFSGVVQAGAAVPAAPVSVTSDVAVEHTQMSERPMMRRRTTMRQRMMSRRMMTRQRMMNRRMMMRQRMTSRRMMMRQRMMNQRMMRRRSM